MLVFMVVMTAVTGLGVYLCERVDRPRRRLQRQAREAA